MRSVDGGGLDNAKNYLLQVRKRAYAGNEAMAQSYVDAIGSADAMFDAIVTSAPSSSWARCSARPT